jgi:PKD repeat protein
VVYSLPTKPLTPSGDLILCINSPSSTYTSATTFATSYEWELNPSTAGVIFNNGQNAVINWDNAFVGKAYLRVRGINTCGTGEWSTFTEITISTQAIPPVINGNFKPCAGETVIYSSSSSDSIIWSVEPLNSYSNIKVLSKSQIEITWNRDNLVSTAAAIKTYSKSNCGTSTIKIDSIAISRFSTTGTIPVLLSTIKPFYCSSDSAEIIFSTTNQLLWFANNQQIGTGYKNTINFKSGIKQINVTSILSNGCYSASKTIDFNVDLVKADFSASTLQTNVGAQVDFKNLSIGGDTYNWDFGDNSFNSTNKDEYHTFYNKGIYTIKLEVASKNKCADVMVKSNYINVIAVSVEEFESGELSIYPNPFNNIIHVVPNFQDHYQISITDVTGRVLYINNSMIKEINTEEFISGVYFLKIETKDKAQTYKFIKL